MHKDLPHVTVATVVPRQGCYLLVRESADGETVYNQPAGHLEAGETLMEAAVRETFEETAWQVSLTHLLGVYQYTSPVNNISYVRVCFIAEALHQDPGAELDVEIIEAVWLSAAQLRDRQWRSPMVMQAIADYESGRRYPLEMIQV